MLNTLLCALLCCLPLQSLGQTPQAQTRIVPLPSSPGDLPLLAPGKHMGLIYSDPNPKTQLALDSAFAQSLQAGVDAYELALSWRELESAPGTVNTDQLRSLLQTLQSAGLATYLSITTIDTVGLSLPPDLLDPLDSTQLRPGLHWNSPQLQHRFGRLLDSVAPLLVNHGGFFLCVGNEVDVYLGQRPQDLLPFAAFVKAARERVHRVQPQLAVGASISFAGLSNMPSLMGRLQQVGDNVPLTYYPLASDFSVLSPSTVNAHMRRMASSVYPRSLLIQEFGYPSGNAASPGNGSSEAKQRQFIENCFASFRGMQRLRFASCLHLADYDPLEVQRFAAYYGVSNPLFSEYLGTLGMHDWKTGRPKPAFASFLAGLDSL